MGKERPNIISIAGFDPSGGAGILADVKTFESHKTLGMAVCTSLTVQNDVAFKQSNWVAFADIEEQLAVLHERFRFKVAKIGLVENFEVLQQIVTCLKEANPAIKIVCDPVLKASAGFVFHTDVAKKQLETLLPQLFMLTPNWDEAQQLSGQEDAKEGAKYLSRFCHVYLKGGHNEEALGKDFLFSKQQKEYALNPKRTNAKAKHGSGCVLSSALAAHIALEYPLLKACVRAKDYTLRFLESNRTNLGFHK